MDINLAVIVTSIIAGVGFFGLGNLFGELLKILSDYLKAKVVNLIKRIRKENFVTTLFMDNVDQYGIELSYIKQILGKGKDIIVPWQNQKKLCDLILEKCSTGKLPACLICGNPGSGKTTLATIIAQELSKKINKDVTVLSGFDILNESHTITSVNKQIWNSDTIYILCIDDIDIGLKYADQNSEILQTKRTGTIIGKNKVSFNRALDVFRQLPRLLVFATSNTPIEVLEKNYHSYIRDGRFDIKVGLPDRD